MANALVFNLVPLFEQMWRPEIWAAETDSEGRANRLIQKIPSARLADWDIASSADILKGLEYVSNLKPEVLTERFCKKVGRTTPTLDTLWAERITRAPIESFIQRQMELWLLAAEKGKWFICFEADKRPSLDQYLLEFEPGDATPLVLLNRHENGLTYQLQMQFASGKPIDLSQVMVLGQGVPARFVFGQGIFSAPNCSGKMLMSFKDKTEVEIPKINERTWLHKFLKKNIDRNVAVEATGFNISEQKKLLQTNITLQRHLFDEQLCLQPTFIYTDRAFGLGGPDIVSRIVFPEDETQEISLEKTIRDKDKERNQIGLLCSYGLTQEGPLLRFDEALSLENTLAFLRLHETEWQLAQIVISYTLPEKEAKISEYSGEVKVSSTPQRDWFDVNVTVEIGPYKINFVAFAPLIQKKIPTFTLPDHCAWVIPEAWFTRYSELASLYLAQEQEQTDTESPTVSVSKHNATVLEALDIKLEAPVVSKKKVAPKKK